MAIARNTTLAAALGASLLMPACAFAADLAEQPYVEPLPVATGGWYLRGDIGYKFYNSPNIAFVTPTYTDPWNNTSLDNTWMLGAGVGYKFNDYFRADATVDYEFNAGAYGEGYCGGCGGLGYSIETADISAWTMLLNGYIDLGTYAGITPYVGAGIGTSYLETSNISYINPNGVTGTWNGAGQWNFAWALMAGASYAITPNTALDLSYRYLNLGDAVSGYIPAGGGGTIQYNNVDANEIRLGLRYSFY